MLTAVLAAAGASSKADYSHESNDGNTGFILSAVLVAAAASSKADFWHESSDGNTGFWLIFAEALNRNKTTKICKKKQKIGNVPVF